ncbi:MAG: hypothetical protein MJB12_20360 [Firmicutes bacterium]|nr:hypothetical protein [Bacillota bacterium]
MKNDERVNIDVNAAKSMGYTIFWFGIFALLLYRWFYLNETLMSTLDIFVVWIIASLAQFFTLAAKGIPVAYPVSMSKKEQRYFIFLVPLFSGFVTAMILLFFKQVRDFNHLSDAFGKGYLFTLLIFIVYKAILYFWEKRYTE